MRQRMLRLANKYRSLALIAALLLIKQAAFSQQHRYTPTSAWGYTWGNGEFRQTLGIPNDTFHISPEDDVRPYIAWKDSLLYAHPIGGKWDVVGTRANSGSSGGSGGVDFLTKQNFGDTATYDATRSWVLQQLNSYTPTTRFLDSMQAARFTYLKAGDTTYLHNQFVKLSTNNAANSNLLFANGLVYSSVTNQVSALYQSPIWNANRFQGYPVDAVICNGCVPYLDSANRIIRWRLPDSATIQPILDRIDNIGFWADDRYFDVKPAGPIVGDKDSFTLKQSFLDDITNVTTPGNYVTSPDFFDSLANIRYDLLHNYYTRTESDARFYPLTSNPAGYLTSVLSAGNVNNYITTATGTGSLQGEPDFQYDDVLNYLSLGGTVHPDFRLISTGYVNGMTSRIAPNVAGRIFGASKGGMNLQGYSDSLRYPGLRLQGYMSSTTGANIAPITMESFRPGTTYYRQPLAPTDTAFSMYSGARDSAGVLLMSMLGNGNMYVAGTVYGPGGTPIGNNYTFSNSSIVNTGGNLALAGDAATPAANTVYGVDASGTKGFRNTTSIDNSNMIVGDGVKYAGNGAFVRRPRFTVISTGTGGTASLDSNANALTVNFTGSTAPTTIAINNQTASYVLTLADAGKLVRQNVASANTVTVPPNSSVAFPVGTQITISNTGTGQVTFAPGSGVTINSAGGALKLRLQYSAATAIKTDTDTWLLTGDISL